MDASLGLWMVWSGLTPGFSHDDTKQFHTPPSAASRGEAAYPTAPGWRRVERA